jgi:hypothetical protein
MGQHRASRYISIAQCPNLKGLNDCSRSLTQLTLVSIWEILVIAEGELIKNTAVGGVIYACGAVTEASAIELMTFEQLAEAMKRGGALAGKHRQPGKKWGSLTTPARKDATHRGRAQAGI